MIAALIQARLNSSRLPKKCLLPLGNSTVLGQVVNRCRLSKKLDDIIVVIAPDDTGELVAECDRLGVLWSKYDNGMRDVLAEYYHAMTEYDVDFVVRITSDCPCVDPPDIDRMVKLHLDSKADCTYNRCNSKPGGWSDGFDIEVIGSNALSYAHHNATLPYDREHVTSYIRKGHTFSKIEEPYPRVVLPAGILFSINTEERYDRLFKLFEKLPEDFKTEDIARLL
ncbi:MAG: cytidylyltransferase domain-containing protein [Planctomycetota bacterium]